MTSDQKETLQQLQKQILEMQGFKPALPGNAEGFGLGPLEHCFPNAVFPVGTIHEFLTDNPEEAAASDGFIAGLLAKLMETGNACLWISRNRKLFPPAMQSFGVMPEQIIFIDLYREKEILWVMEEALKCEGLAAVIAELPDIDFAQSRRLQLAVEKSHVTGMLLRKEPKRLSATACTVRWHVKPQPSEMMEGMPGVGHPRWEVNLLKVRNGHTGSFLLEWAEDHFAPFAATEPIVEHTKQAV
ncbi:ImuA family protein [Pedobacter metabolipauper]|uniref:Protein ImuA n=1 Tax=Pedobacter metabolipauper TaxID=425513 RepID=A0A4R6SZJ5_9SPHI|nr:Error-prone repair protein ImuA [Pedobacter metabolipauper]TDQ11507.1 protein ImuA [Pedobacter metabolipauper]